MDLTVNPTGYAGAWWGGMPLPRGARVVGTVTRGEHDTGALILLESGLYAQGNAGALRSLPQTPVREALKRTQGGRQ